MLYPYSCTYRSDIDALDSPFKRSSASFEPVNTNEITDLHRPQIWGWSPVTRFPWSFVCNWAKDLTGPPIAHKTHFVDFWHHKTEYHAAAYGVPQIQRGIFLPRGVSFILSWIPFSSDTRAPCVDNSLRISLSQVPLFVWLWSLITIIVNPYFFNNWDNKLGGSGLLFSRGFWQVVQMATVCLTWQLKIHARTPLQGVITVPQNSVPLCREFEGRGSPLSSHLAILPQKQSQNFRVMVARSISWTKSSNFPALKKTLDRGTCRANLGTDIFITLLSSVFLLLICFSSFSIFQFAICWVMFDISLPRSLPGTDEVSVIISVEVVESPWTCKRLLLAVAQTLGRNSFFSFP